MQSELKGRSTTLERHATSSPIIGRSAMPLIPCSFPKSKLSKLIKKPKATRNHYCQHTLDKWV
jgi:hypothetical protein